MFIHHIVCVEETFIMCTWAYQHWPAIIFGDAWMTLQLPHFFYKWRLWIVMWEFNFTHIKSLSYSHIYHIYIIFFNAFLSIKHLWMFLWWDLIFITIQNIIMRRWCLCPEKTQRKSPENLWRHQQSKAFRFLFLVFLPSSAQDFQVITLI